MRIWADVYNSSGVKVAQIHSLISANATAVLDQAGTFDLQCALDPDVLSYLVNGNEVALFAQEDEETPFQWTRGKIVKPRVQETADNVNISIGGRDQINELNFRTVGLGRSYSAQTMQTIMSDLAELVPGWTASVETASASLLQTARFDGSRVLRAISQSLKQLGLHFRLSETSRQIEVGAFGVAATTANGEAIWAMQAPSSFSKELYSNDNVLIIDSISVTEDSDPVLNWAIPMGAGEGTAATTLKDTSYEILNASDNTIYRAGTVPTYPIYLRVNDFGINEYYIDASDGDELRQDTLSFKTIGPIANSALAKQLASDALADACMASLARTRIALTSYTLNVRKMRVNVKPGELLHVQYKGMVPTIGGNLTYIDVDDDLWVMSVQHSASDSGFTHTLQVSTIDRHVMDDTDILVEVLDRSEVRNVSIQTFPFGFQDSSERVIQGNTPATTPYRDATFGIQIPDIFVDVIKVSLHFITRPLYSTTDVGPVTGAATPYALDYSFRVYESTNYPSDISLFIDGVDRTTALGGPWNPSAGNSAVDVTLDITNYIVNAVGGLYQDHSIVFKAGDKTGEGRVSTSHPSESTDTSNGVIEAKILFLGTARAIF